MATDNGVRDALVTRINNEIQARKEKIAQLRDRLAAAQLEDAAQATLTTGDNTSLVNAGLVDQHDAAQIQGDIDRAQAEIQALQNFRQAVRAVA